MPSSRKRQSGQVIATLLLATAFAGTALVGGLATLLPDNCKCEWRGTWNGSNWTFIRCAVQGDCGGTCDEVVHTSDVYTWCECSVGENACNCFGGGTTDHGSEGITGVECRTGLFGCNIAQHNCEDTSLGSTLTPGSQYYICGCY